MLIEREFPMTKEELYRLTNETEWALPLIQDIVSGKVNYEQIEELYKYVCSRQLQTVLDELCIREAEEGNPDNFLDISVSGGWTRLEYHTIFAVN